MDWPELLPMIMNTLPDKVNDIHRTSFNKLVTVLLDSRDRETRSARPIRYCDIQADAYLAYLGTEIKIHHFFNISIRIFEKRLNL